MVSYTMSRLVRNLATQIEMMMDSNSFRIPNVNRELCETFLWMKFLELEAVECFKG